MRYPVKAKKFFTVEERTKIEAATVRAESRTVGEVRVAVVDASSRYREAQVLGGIFLGSAVSLALTALFFHNSVWSFVPLAFVLYFPSFFLFKASPAMKRVFAGPRRQARAVRDRAVRVFYEEGLYRTKGATGVLFFVSLLERKVWVLADKGIMSKIDQPVLNKFADMVSRGIQAGRAADALLEAIEEFGILLAAHYPRTGTPEDELPDTIIYPQGPTPG